MESVVRRTLLMMVLLANVIQKVTTHVALQSASAESVLTTVNAQDAKILEELKDTKRR